jgi:hypothetical protein
MIKASQNDTTAIEVLREENARIREENVRLAEECIKLKAQLHVWVPHSGDPYRPYCMTCGVRQPVFK